jgi:uncharacterized membrane protein
MMVIGGNLLYHCGQKSVPKNASPLLVLIVAYAISLTICIVIYCFTSDRSMVSAIKGNNWSVLAIGLGAVIVEIGYLLAYRMGWNISVTSMTSSVAVATLLIPIGLLFFRERLSTANFFGIILCAVGLMLLTRK